MAKPARVNGPDPYNFDVRDTDTKFIAARLIKMMVLAVNRNKLDYGTVRYIHRQVLARTKLSVPRKGEKVYALPAKEDFEKFFSVVESVQDRLMFQFLMATGSRVAEAVGITREDLDLTNQTVKILGKGNKQRLIPLSHRMVERIRLFLSGRKNRHLFESPRLGTKFTTRRVEQLCQDYRKKAGITKQLTPHTFRHHFFSKLAEKKINSDVRAMIAGHEDADTQKIYTHMGMAGLKPQILDAISALESENLLL
jgi:integrase/recombinase XerD